VRLAYTRLLLAGVVLLAVCLMAAAKPSLWVTARDGKFLVGGKPYYYLGTNYWYATLLPYNKDPRRGIDRLRRELDFLKTHGVTNLRLMAGAEGSGEMNGVRRVGPSVQPVRGRFDAAALRGLDVVLDEMRRRDMKAVVFLSNNWEWSGGFQQYLIWNGLLSSEWLSRKPTWDELRDNVAKFYSCAKCVEQYRNQVRFVLGHRNTVNGTAYRNDPTIMAWELANEPRPMRPAANDAYEEWIRNSAALIRSLDKRHLITTGHEGWIGTQDVELFERVHADRNIDYVTIHIWPKNWGWLTNGRVADGYDNALAETQNYITDNARIATKLRKPLVIEEFGLPRDGGAFDALSSTGYRDRYYAAVLDHLGTTAAGANFWAFGGSGRPIPGQLFWKPDDDLTGDPPMEEQGLNSVFDSDRSTWEIISKAAMRLKSPRTL
jgi:mannan endo-1,4-beta-mannosidase